MKHITGFWPEILHVLILGLSWDILVPIPSLENPGLRIRSSQDYPGINYRIFLRFSKEIQEIPGLFSQHYINTWRTKQWWRKWRRKAIQSPKTSPKGQTCCTSSILSSSTKRLGRRFWWTNFDEQRVTPKDYFDLMLSPGTIWDFVRNTVIHDGKWNKEEKKTVCGMILQNPKRARTWELTNSYHTDIINPRIYSLEMKEPNL